MVIFIEPTDPLLDPIDATVRPAWIEAAVARLHPLISRASFHIATDEQGRDLPVPPARDVLRRAVAAQVMAWWRWEVDPTAPASKSRAASSMSLGPATVSYDHRDNHAAEFAKVRDGIDPTALSLLRTIIHQPIY